MLRLGSCFRQFHSLHPSIAPPSCRRQPVAWTIASIQQSQPLIICKSSYKVQTHNRLLKQRSISPLVHSSPSKYSSLDNKMRDLVNIASMGRSSTLAANASPKKPEKAVNRASSTGQSVVGSTDEVYQVWSDHHELLISSAPRFALVFIL